MAANPATAADVVARWRPLTVAESAVATTRIDDAWQLLISVRPKLPGQMDIAEVSTPNVRRLIVDAVLRVLRNPDGFSAERLGDYSYTRDGSVSAGRLHFSADELAEITPGFVGTKSIRLNGAW